MATATEKARKGACDWAIKIAKDNKYHYGRSKWAHHSGCPFCGTQGTKKKYAPKSQWDEVKYSMCCNPFVTASYHHGAGAKEVDCKVKSKRINLANDPNPALKNKKAFKKISKPKKVTDLVAGDILLTKTHCMLYVGDGKIAHAGHHDNGKKGSYWNSSISVQKIPSKQWSRTTKIYRYIGKGKFKDDAKATKVKVQEIDSNYKVGTTYELLDDMNVRTGASIKANKKKFVNVSASAQKLCLESTKPYAVLKKGTRVTCKKAIKEGNYTWMQIPSGYICAKGNNGEYVKVATVEEPKQTTLAYSLFPMKYLRITATPTSTTAHKKCSGDYPVDLGGKDQGRDYFYAPFDLKILRKYTKASHSIWMRSTSKVQTPSGAKYVYIMCEHQDNSEMPPVGKIVHKGDRLFREGNNGLSSGYHLHVSYGISDNKIDSIGSGWHKATKGGWSMKIPSVKNVPIEKAVYVDKTFTKILATKGIKFREV